MSRRTVERRLVVPSGRAPIGLAPSASGAMFLPALTERFIGETLRLRCSRSSASRRASSLASTRTRNGWKPRCPHPSTPRSLAFFRVTMRKQFRRTRYSSAWVSTDPLEPNALCYRGPSRASPPRVSLWAFVAPSDSEITTGRQARLPGVG
jgi:hypothetical protein